MKFQAIPTLKVEAPYSSFSFSRAFPLPKFLILKVWVEAPIGSLSSCFSVGFEAGVCWIEISVSVGAAIFGAESFGAEISEASFYHYPAFWDAVRHVVCDS